MIATPKNVYLSPQEYLEWEEKQALKYYPPVPKHLHREADLFEIEGINLSIIVNLIL
ncbi:MAG: hypothetical protein WBM32_11400 [Crocosphaera sp.]|jgi:hypothetical protein